MIPRFRAWLIHDKIMFDLIGFKDLDKDYIELYTTTNGTLKFSKKNIVLMQSTGIYDDNNNEIFEGDVINIKAHNSVIDADTNYLVIDSANFRLEFQQTKIIGKGYGLEDKDYAMKVIGNIHEKPELIEKK